MIKKYFIFWFIVYILLEVLSAIKTKTLNKRFKEDGYKNIVSEEERLVAKVRVFIYTFIPLYNILIIIVFLNLLFMPYERYIKHLMEKGAITYVSE